MEYTTVSGSLPGETSIPRPHQRKPINTANNRTVLVNVFGMEDILQKK
jgi:hypothetical protein